MHLALYQGKKTSDKIPFRPSLKVKILVSKIRFFREEVGMQEPATCFTENTGCSSRNQRRVTNFSNRLCKVDKIQRHSRVSHKVSGH